MADKEQKQRWWAVFLQCQECEARLSARIVITKATASITVVSQSYHKVKKEEVKLKNDLSASPEPPIYGDILHILQIY
jgi:NAD(P)H-dependent flavin oxidoreductase YrpB (nitropropane dioxygenase family)